MSRSNQPMPALCARGAALTRGGRWALICLVSAPVFFAPSPGQAQSKAGPAAVERQRAAPSDPYRWLEDVEGARAMGWVRAHNAATMKTLGADSLYRKLNQRILAVLDASDRIPYPTILGDRLYNFWQDAKHPRGYWRSSTWATYLAGAPEWRTVLDIDSLAATEKVAWAWRGATCLPPAYRRCLVELSRGGADAV